MIEFFALVDYYNVAPLKRGANNDYKGHLAAVESLVDSILATAICLDPKPAEVRVRLYGGWHDSATDSATEAREILGSIARKFYPTRAPLRVFLEMADSLVSLPGENLSHTLRFWKGLAPFSISPTVDTCRLGSNSCALQELDQWRRGRCPRFGDCGVATNEVTKSLRQKLVDTALVADAITLAHESEGWVAPVSNDDDILPGVVVASRQSRRVVFLRYGKHTSSPYDHLMDRHGIMHLNIV